eukprot:IDg14920t1
MVGGRKDDILGAIPGTGSRSHLLKATRRLGRSIRTEAKLFMQRPSRQRWWMRPLIALISVLTVLSLLTWQLWPGEISFHDGSFHRESSHFTHNQRLLPLPRQSAWDSSRLKACSWVYLEVNAGDGRHTHAFFTNGNTFLEEYLRASQASMRGFCAVALEPDPQMAAPLAAVRSEKGAKASRFDVYAGVAVGTASAIEQVRLQAHIAQHPADADGRVVDNQEKESVHTTPLTDVVRILTYPLAKSGGEGNRSMHIALGNRQNGTVIVRLNTANLREAYWYLDMLDSSGVLCERIDRLVLNLEPMAIDNSRHFLIDRKVNRNFDELIHSASNERFEHERGVAGILDIARDIAQRPTCRAVIYVVDGKGEVAYPPLVTKRNVFYSILAGHPTFDERVSAQTSSWMTGVPLDRVAIYTNVKRNKDELEAAQGRVTIVTKPARPELEQQLQMMQSWSHLVRVRETWDRFMKADASIKWLMLVDDDTFVFPSGLRQYLTGFDPRRRVWGGSGEQARVDNGDHGKFARWLRDLDKEHSGKHCFIDGEDIPESLRGRRITYSVSSVMNGRRVAHVVSHMCSDAFCRRGCPAVPQGAAIFLSRALVSALRPHIENCER